MISPYTLFKNSKKKIFEMKCPCGETFYTYSKRSIYHNNACKQYFFRLKQNTLEAMSDTTKP